MFSGSERDGWMGRGGEGGVEKAVREEWREHGEEEAVKDVER